MHIFFFRYFYALFREDLWSLLIISRCNEIPTKSVVKYIYFWWAYNSCMVLKSVCLFSSHLLVHLSTRSTFSCMFSLTTFLMHRSSDEQSLLLISDINLIGKIWYCGRESTKWCVLDRTCIQSVERCCDVPTLIKQFKKCFTADTYLHRRNDQLRCYKKYMQPKKKVQCNV